MGLVKRVLEAPAILAVEEPEAHLHPNLVRELFRFLSETAGDPQLIVSTHSPMMMDKKCRTNNWLCHVVDDGSSVLEQIVEADDIRLALADLGSVPSDAYMKDFIIMAEGGTETEAAFPIWANTLGKPFPDNIGLIPLGGKGKVKGHLQIWLNIMKFAPARYVVALDANAAAEKRETLRKMQIPQNSIRLMPWTGLEDTFPPKVVAEVLKELFGIDLAQEKRLPRTGREAFIKQLVRKKGAERPHWKLEFARAVASRMTKKEVPKEFVELLDSVYSLLP